MYSQRIPPSPVILHSPEKQDWYMASHSPVTRVLLFSRRQNTPQTALQWVFTTLLLGPNGQKSPQEAIQSPCAWVWPKQPKPSNTSKTLGLCQTKMFDGVSFEASVEKGQPSNTSNGLGNSKGKGGRGSVRGYRGGAFWQDQGSKV